MTGKPAEKSKITTTLVVQTIFISVVSVIVGKLADRHFPMVWMSGVVGAVLGAVVGGLLSVGFEKLAKGQRPVPPGPENV